MYKKLVFRTSALSGLILITLSLMLAMPDLAKADGPISSEKLNESGSPPLEGVDNPQDGGCVSGDCPTVTSISAQDCGVPVKIMPLGDSITKGSQSSSLVGYRQQLYLSLTTNDYVVDFVGSQINGTDDFDKNHEGHSGRTDDWIASNVYSFLSTNPADVVLLHIGTNDLLQVPPDNSPNDIANILDEIDRYDENITVVLARIINRYPTTTTVTTFNNDVQTMALSRIASGDKIVIVDQENALIYPDDLADGIHPNLTGYNKMANVWLDALDNFLPVCGAVAPQITSDPIISAYADHYYYYDVQASGNPPPTYALTTAPSTMTIDPDTGKIQWTPTATGSVPVTVKASNSADSDTQNFTINVSAAAPICPDGIIGYWKLDELSSGSYDDFFNGHDGACPAGKSCPAPATGQVNGGQLFSNDTGIDVPAHSDFDWNANGSFSIELWMKGVGGQTCPSGSQVMVGRDDSASDLQWWLGCKSGQARFRVADRSGSEVILENAGPSITNGAWHHLVALRDGANNLNRVYIDGTEVVSATKTFTDTFIAPSANINLGYFPSGFHLIQGTLDEVAIYNRALPSAEIQQHYLYGLDKSGICQTSSLQNGVYLPIMMRNSN